MNQLTRPNRLRTRPAPNSADLRLGILRALALLGFLAVAGRLVSLQIGQHAFYSALASNKSGVFEDLFPERGEVFLRDPKSHDGRFPAIINRNSYVVFADTTRALKTAAEADAAAKALATALSLDEAELRDKLGKPDDPYIPLARKLTDAQAETVRALDMDGIALATERQRYYPEGKELAHVTGFLGSNDRGERVGRYGIEGFWNQELSGASGLLASTAASLKTLFAGADDSLRPARDGDSLLLTIDRAIQYAACDRLRQAVAKHRADGGTVIIAEPKTGAILAMCSVPDFDPNDFSKTADLGAFNNPAIFQAYEPGSIFKPITLVAAIDAGRVSPNTTYEDTGSVQIGPHTIRNSDGKAHGIQTMTQVLEESLNTGTIYAVNRIGAKPFLKYVEDFGFGSPTGVEMDSEAAGDISSLRKKGDIWSATGSFGQGISVTPLQMVMAFGALANGGKLMAPHIVAERIAPDGAVTKIAPQAVRQVITKRASTLIGGMLANVVENGHGKRAGVPGYWVAGKTGTAQISRADGLGYEKDASIGSFVGYAPVDDPAFVMLVKLERPRDVEWAESSAAPLFGDIAKFLLQYLQIPPDRPV